MAVKISNTLSTFLEQSMIMEKNSLEVLSKIDNAMSTRKDNVVINITDMSDDNKNKTYRIPSFAYLKRSIDRLDATLRGIMAIDDETESYMANIRLSDNSYRKIVTTQLPKEAPDITSVDKISKFNVKSNWFFEDMMNPIVYVSLDLTGKVPDRTEKILVRRYILNCDSEPKKKAFENLCNQSEIKFEDGYSSNDFVGTILSEKITYALDEEIKELPPREKRYSGKFIITDTSLPTEDYNGDIVKIYTLNTTTYTDNILGTSCELKQGDLLEKNTNTIYSRYKVLSVSGNKVVVQLISGVAGLDRGTELRISATQESQIKIDIPVGLHEREVIFIKPIDPFSNIPADNWSPGIAFFSDNLVFEQDTKQTLGDYYRNNVVDYGQVMLSYARDYFPTIREAVEPNAPELKGSDFIITQINGHLIDTTQYNKLLNLISEKTTVGSEIENLTKQISDMSNYILTTKFESEEEKEKYMSDLKDLKDRQDIMKTSFDSYVTSINKITTDMGDVSPKYRIRGFWNMPAPQFSNDTGEQQVIRFRIQYQYRSSTGEEQPVTEIATSFGGLAKFSNWNETMSKVRERVYNGEEWVWKDVVMNDPDSVKINQCDIPISPGEEVWIRVKAISEAGWPSNPIESKWSNTLKLRFDDYPELKVMDIKNLIEQNRIDTAVMKNIILNS